MKKIYFVLFLLFTHTFVLGQNEASVWYFGANAGLNFTEQNGIITATAILDGQINTLEGCTSISDDEGNLLFYSDGRTVWDSNHQIMPNGDYFEDPLNNSGLLGDPSSTSSGLIVPRPNNPNQYYLFTVDEPHHENPNDGSTAYISGGGSVPSADDGLNNGFNYSLIDMSLNNGFGDVVTTEKNIHLITYDESDIEQIRYKCSEKITAVKSADCNSFWVITHFVNTFYAFKVTENGVLVGENNEILPPESSTVGPTVPTSGYRKNALGYIKASPDGSKLVVAHHGFAESPGADTPGGVYSFDFNNETGEVSNPIELYSPSQGNSPYGVEFSANNKKVYATIGNGNVGVGGSEIWQWDLEAIDIPSSGFPIHTSTTIAAGALQLGIDGKIYRAQFEFQANTGASQFLGFIDNPDASGNDVIYFQNVLNLGSAQSRIGLPPFIQSLFNSEIDIIQNGISETELALCTGDSYTLQAEDITGADYAWSFDGNPLTETSAQLLVDTPGFYEVYIEPNNGDCPIEGSAVVGIFDIPVSNELSNVNVCDDDLNDGFYSFDFTNKNSEALLLQDPSVYTVSYFETEDDASSGDNQIIFPYTNIENPQTIYVRVENSENNNCFDINSFALSVFSIPQIEQLEPIEFCDNLGDPIDGIATTNLEDIIPIIRGTQVESETDITFYTSQDDADTSTDAIPLNYINSTAFNETVFVRIENTANTDCFSTSSFDMIVNPVPVANNITILQCDEDGIPEGFTTFNINNYLEDITDNVEGNMVEFYVSLTDAENEENPINADAFENYFNPQIIYARVTNTSTSCTNFSEISLEVSATASNNTSIELCDSDGTEDGFMMFNLADANASVLANSPTGLDIQYYETYLDALLETNPISTSYTNTTAYNQTIYSRVENTNACYGISEIELTVFELPQLETEFETQYCLNFFPETMTLDGGVLEDSPSNYYYEWSTGETTSEIEINAPGSYNVRVFNTDGCFKDRTVTVLPSNIATIESIEVIDASQNNSISVYVDNESVGDYEYALNDINGPYQDSNTFTNVRPGLYTVYVRDKNNCGIAEDLISVIGFPKFFTPNDDTINDYWQVYGITEQFQANSTIFIFDRYGKLLVELDPLSSGWDGTYNGANMPTSDYWFKVTLEDGRTFTNHFTLKR